MILRRIGVVIATATLGLAALATTADAQAAPTRSLAPAIGSFHPIKNSGNGLCLQPSSPADGSPIIQMPCDSSSILQGWKFTARATNHYEFLNQGSGGCLDSFGPAANETPMVTGECKKISNEEFNTNRSLPAVTILEARIGFRNTGFCVDVPGGESTVGLAVRLWVCNGTPAQSWNIGF